MSFRRPVIAGLIGLGFCSTASAAEGGGLMSVNFATFFWTALTFVLMVLILGRFAWKPLIGAVDARENSIRDSIEQARVDREQAEALVKQHRELLTEARRERAAAVERGKRDAEKVKAEILEEARAQREQTLKQTEVQVEASLRQARSELRATAADLAIFAAEKLLSRNIDDAAQRKLVEQHLAEIERQSGDPSSPPS